MTEKKSNAGRKPVVETEAFQQAVDKRVAEQLEAFKADLLKAADAPAVAVPGGGVSDVLSEVLSKLSMNMASLGQQGQHAKPVSPEELVRREAAANRMVDLLTAARAGPREDWPTYRLIAKTVLNERLIEPFKMVDKKAVNNEIAWTGIPNDAMQPINTLAQEVFAAWRGSTGGQTQLVPTADQRPLFVTAAGLTVRGEPPKRQHVAAPENFADDLAFSNNDPNAPEIAVLGTVANKARSNTLAGVSN
jgi:hypothetical protein